MGGIRGEATQEIGASAQACFDALVAIETYPEWYPLTDEVEVRERDAAGRPAVVEAVTDARVRRVRYVLRYAYEPPGRISASYVEGDFKDLRLTWTLEALAPERTRATLALAGEVSWVLDRLIAPVRDKVRRELIDDAVAALGRRVAPS